MLEGVLKVILRHRQAHIPERFNPWYVGGGVKSLANVHFTAQMFSFNPWYVGGGVKSAQ